MAKKLTVSASPHVRSNETTTGIMLDVIIALVPAFVMSVVYFGTRALALTAVTVGVAVLAEYVSRKVMKRANTIGDLSAVVTGLILAMNLPATLPLWMAAIGSIIAVVVVKQMFGGIGQNFVNPAMTARIILMVSFPTAMAKWIVPFANGWSADAVTSATPMAQLATVSGGDVSAVEGLPSLAQMLIGYHGGSMGEVCSIALIVGGLYLILRKVISPAIPLTFIGTVAVCMLIAGKGNFEFVAYELLGGGLMLGAFFMATDYTTSPINLKGKIIFGIGCGLITSVIRIFGSLPEGVSFSIILMNIFVPHIENFTVAKPFGSVKEKKSKKEEAKA
ncbi:MAG: RnfABCDGE type electron transport complex subunit D [Faecalibacterium sp.]|nr:RnfABCDGE type electron transport complex subunit D [Ruminococcus sp.]MCM1392326.1 RnfABCDGE type electron transport complex subunit D [Ruminococcus sp.]MCM1486049.1 RnfABCDGE type electron transport complex subunit D [Faecalibacterium sp.]